MKLVVRYLAYFVFALVTPIFWMMFAFLVFGFLPFPSDPACHFDPAGCPRAPLVVRLLGTICGYSALPLSVVAFIFYRKMIRRILGLGEPMWRDQ